MTCSTCGTVNPAGRKFCGECGTKLAVSCASCGAALDAGQKFCGECGTPVAASASPAASAPAWAAGPAGAAGAATNGPVSERRLVSVLFADLVGFTPFSEERDAEDVRETLTRYFEIARDVIQRHGGTVEKFIGDAVMAVWGTPTAREDDAERAVRTALELLDAIHDLGPGISARAGVLTGEAAVTLGATDQGMVAGDLVNTAARLQSVAPPNTVLVGESTYRSASAAIAFEPAGDQLLKGKLAPVPAWRALRVVAERGGRGRADAIEAPFTGRDAELRLLKELFHTIGSEGRARLVSITGPAGIGKSRLARELEKYLDGVVETVWWHHGRSPSYSGGITFWALGEMIRARCGLAETDGEAETRAKVAQTLARHLPDPAERAWVEPAILQLLGVDVPPVSAAELFARWRVLFERLAADATVVLVFEDLHWADPGTLDFIDHLLDWSKASPILILTLARPDLLDTRPDWGAGRRNFVAVALDPLADADMAAMLTALVPGLPEPAVRRIVERAEGIPLYAVETVRMLVAEHRLEERDGVYVPIGQIDTLAVPETLTALIAARLDTLDPADRALVLDAAVLGQRFTLEGLAAVSGIAPSVLEPRLRGLVRRELLTLEADPRSPERGQYGFVQALIREVAYNTLSRRDRKDRHLAAARFFESLGNDELAGAQAGHYLSAHANAQEGPEAEALAAQARVALRGASDRAANLGSYDQAAGLLRQALSVTTLPAEQAELQERLGRALLPAARYAETRQALEIAVALHRDGGDTHALARATALLGECLVSAKLMDDARAVLEEGLARTGDLEPSDPALLALQGQLARSYLFTDRNREAVAMADVVLDQAEHHELLAILADAFVTKGTALGTLGRPLEAVAILELGVRIAEEHDLVQTQLRGLLNLTGLLGDIDPMRAYRIALDALVLARRIGSPAWTRRFVANVGYHAYRVGEWDAGEAELRRVLEDDLEPSDLLISLNNLINFLAMRGRSTEDLMARLDQVADSLPGIYKDIFVGEAKAYVAVGDGRITEGARLLQDIGTNDTMNGGAALLASAAFWLWAADTERSAAAVDVFDARQLHLPGLTALRDGVRGVLLAADGRRSEGLAEVEAAHGRLGDLQLPDDAGRLAIAAAHVIGSQEAAIAAMLSEARAFYERVDARPMIGEIDAVAARTAAPPSDGRPVRVVEAEAAIQP
jgi:class 3 adenylate cyclase/tetratricopeptide (TPR) repeat protein